ncbi:peptidoglycan-binding protein [Streptomyces sp. NPDC059575]|uniref:peptidoglycan-binding protein n=1 Tax=Streptomyces sp. NPDC059575 TaxID=3346872 RepID=UPI00368251CD
MPTPPDPQPPRPGRIVEPVRVVRARRQDALAELMRELLPEDGAGPREAGSTPPPGPPVTPPPPPPPPYAPAGAEDDTQELTPVSEAPPARAGHRRAVAVLALGAAALVGFGCALLLPARQNATTAGPAHSAASRPVTITPATTGPATPAAPAPAASADPDGPGTLREGDSGPGVTELRERLLRIPDVFRDGSPSGGYDAVLAEAVARFQVWYGVSGDERGVYGDDTRRALESRT